MSRRSLGEDLKVLRNPSAKFIASGVRIVAGSMTTTCTPQGRISHLRSTWRSGGHHPDLAAGAFRADGPARGMHRHGLRA